jgi:hypothetical protein
MTTSGVSNAGSRAPDACDEGGDGEDNDDDGNDAGEVVIGTPWSLSLS